MSDRSWVYVFVTATVILAAVGFWAAVTSHFFLIAPMFCGATFTAVSALIMARRLRQ